MRICEVCYLTMPLTAKVCTGCDDSIGPVRTSFGLFESLFSEDMLADNENVSTTEAVITISLVESVIVLPWVLSMVG